MAEAGAINPSLCRLLFAGKDCLPGKSLQHDHVHIHRREGVVHGDAPAAGQRLALTHRPRLDDVEEPERGEDTERDPRRLF